jgi:large subunit ribosomal protein L15
MAVGIVTTNDGPLKLLGDGEINTSLNVTAAAFSATAKSKIESAGGSCKLTEVK